MKRKGLILISAVMLLGCASHPPVPAPAPEAPAPAAAPEPAPAVEVEPEPVPAQAPAKAEGPWRVFLISVKSEQKAAQLSQQFSDKGYRVETEVVEIAGTTWRRIVFPGQHTREEAQQWLAKLEQEFGISGGWIPAPQN